ncbi:hypothetical protein [Mesorhizobium cantuariense]|uniref:Transposase n=1 Tax=Mesorhizobium cantuariense TaxID=1300275 RepID=A0ABV7MXW1_9HYPH
MPTAAYQTEVPTAICTDLDTIFVSMELSRSAWLITSLSPGNRKRISKRAVRSGDVAGLLVGFSQLRKRGQELDDAVRLSSSRRPVLTVLGPDASEGRCRIHVVGPTSIASLRRRRRATTD